MKFVCDRCQTKYSIADEKVRGKILKVRCKSCANIIVVREEGAAVARRASVPVAAVGAPAPRPPIPAVPRAPGPPPIERRAVPRPEPPAEEGEAWYLALDGNRTGPFSRKQLIDKIAPVSKDADLHVWNEKLGAWKAPTEVPGLAGELAARRRPPPPPPVRPLSGSPPPPPPFPGAPRRPTAPPIAVITTAAAAPARPTGAHAVVGSPIGPGVGLKLPPPVAPPGGRRPTGPLTHSQGAGANLAVAPAVAPSPAELELDLDPTSTLETPALPHARGSNGVAHAENGTTASPFGEKSDVLNTLNLAAAAEAGPAPRLLSSEAIVDWQPSSGDLPAARQKATRVVLVLFGVIALICVAALMLTFTKKTKRAQAPAPVSAKAADPLAGIVDHPPSTSEPAHPTLPAPAPSAHGRGHGHGHGASRGRGASTAPTSPPPLGAAAPAAVAEDKNSRYRDTGRNLNISGGGHISRPPPSQGQITRVIANNRNGIKNCYQRALLRDSSLTHGKISVRVNIGISGRVKHTSVDGPSQFRTLEPCIKEIVGRWAFPPADDEYGTEFVYVFQGNE